MVTEGSIWRVCIILIVISVFLLPMTIDYATAEIIYFAGYKDGFYIKSEEQGGMELKLGGAFQVDYRHYGEEQRADNQFDIRHSRFVFRRQSVEGGERPEL
jgi:phosphate-selective porin